MSSASGPNGPTSGQKYCSVESGNGILWVLCQIGLRPSYFFIFDDWLYACLRVSTLIFFIFNIALITLCAFSVSGSLNIWPRAAGMICHERPYLSFSQPHWPSAPPLLVSFLHSMSTSSCDSQFTRNDIASVNLNIGPAFNAVNLPSSRTKSTVITVPLGIGAPSP